MRRYCHGFATCCDFGTGIVCKETLIACRIGMPELCPETWADSLGYLSVDSVKKLAVDSDCDFCDGCFTGVYPSEVPKEIPKDKFESKIKKAVK